MREFCVFVQKFQFYDFWFLNQIFNFHLNYSIKSSYGTQTQKNLFALVLVFWRPRKSASRILSENAFDPRSTQVEFSPKALAGALNEKTPGPLSKKPKQKENPKKKIFSANFCHEDFSPTFLSTPTTFSGVEKLETRWQTWVSFLDDLIVINPVSRSGGLIINWQLINE